ncbi:MAG: DUF4115 domain-containing protein [Succinivibrio sp.]|nr:DUF4115 domain-containing protein [Succinivibrio sp.]
MSDNNSQDTTLSSTSPQLGTEEQVLTESEAARVADEAVSQEQPSAGDAGAEVFDASEVRPEDYANGDDPDKVPVTPTLSDDEVPNMPGAILKHAREMLGLSQREIALKLKMRVNTVSDIEHDRLNQPTAVPFTSKHIERYARLVNIDPDAIVDLYRQNVRQSQQAAEIRPTVEESSRSSGRRWFIAGAACALLVSLGMWYLLSPGSSTEDNQSGALIIEDEVQPRQGQELLGVAPQEGKVGAQAAQPVAAPRQEAVDRNTELARRQAKELGTNEIFAVTDPTLQDTTKDQGGADKTALAAEKPALTLPADKHSKAAGNAEAAPAQRQGSAGAGKNAASAVSSGSPAKEAAKGATQNAAAVAAAGTEKSSEKTPVLAAQLKNISAQAKLVSRNSVGSLNSADIEVRDAVALKVTGNGKLLKQGVYKKGDRVKVTGIPPIVVSVSDSSRVRILYNGGTVKVPGAKQVIFTLPKQ